MPQPPELARTQGQPSIGLSRWDFRDFYGRDTLSTNLDDAGSFRWLLSSWREDLEANNKNLLAPGFHAVALHRYGVWSQSQRGFAGWILNKLYSLAYVFVSAFYGVELPRDAVVGRRLWLPHPAGVVVSRHAQIGDDCMIRQNVTLGLLTGDRPRPSSSAPKLGNGVKVGAGAVVVGGVTVGDGARIGPNAVVMIDVPPDGFAFARSAGTIQPLFARGDTRSESQFDGQTDKGERPVHDTEGEDMDEFIELIHTVIRLDEQIESDTPVISTGIIDSFDVVALLTAVESRFGVIITPEEIDVERFDSPIQMLDLIKRYRS